MRPILYRVHRQIVNYFKMIVRSPKRLIPVLLALLGLMQVSLTWIFGARYQRMPAGMPKIHLDLPMESIWVAAFVLLSLILVGAVLKAFRESPLTFDMAQVDFEFPTPIPRWVILLWKLLGLYVKTAVFVFYFAFILFAVAPTLRMLIGAEAGPSPGIALAALTLFVITLVNLSVVINLVATYRSGGTWWLSSVIRGVALAILAFTIGLGAFYYFRTGDPLVSIVQAVRNPALTILLMPAAWTADLALSPLAGWQGRYALELLAMVALAGGTLVLAVSRKENPFEPSIERSTRMASAKAAVRSGGLGGYRAEMMKERYKRMKPKGGIRPFGRGATAILWKNLNTQIRESGSAALAFIAIVAVALIVPRVVLHGQANGRLVGGIVAGVLAYLAFLTSSMFISMSLRADLKQANMLKPMPIPSWQLLLAEVGNITLQYTVLIWVIVGMTIVIYGGSTGKWVILCGLLLPFATNAVACAQLPVIMLYPKWEDTAQQQISMMISMLVTFLVAGPLIGLFFLLNLVNTPLAVIVTALASLGLAALGIFLGVTAYRKFDPTDD